jgi:uncharacterized protein YoxC
MEAEIVKMAASQGVFAVLFVVLLFYVLKHSEKREERLLSCLERLTTQYEGLTHDVGEIKSDLEDLKVKVGA